MPFITVALTLALTATPYEAATPKTCEQVAHDAITNLQWAAEAKDPRGPIQAARSALTDGPKDCDVGVWYLAVAWTIRIGLVEKPALQFGTRRFNTADEAVAEGLKTHPRDEALNGYGVFWRYTPAQSACDRLSKPKPVIGMHRIYVCARAALDARDKDTAAPYMAELRPTPESPPANGLMAAEFLALKRDRKGAEEAAKAALAELRELAPHMLRGANVEDMRRMRKTLRHIANFGDLPNAAP